MRPWKLCGCFLPGSFPQTLILPGTTISKQGRHGNMSPHVWMGKNISAGMLGLYSASLKQVNGCRVVSEREWHILTPKTWDLAKCWGKWLCWCQCSSAGIQWEQLQDRLQSVGVLEQATRWWQGPCIVMVEEGVAVILIRGAVQGCVRKVCNFCVMHSLSYSLCNLHSQATHGIATAHKVSAFLSYVA